MAKRGRPKKLSIVKPKAEEPLQAQRDIPQGDEAAEALRELAAMNDRVKRFETVEAEAKSYYQVARGDREEAQQALSERLWQLTHRSEMPLFDTQQADADLNRVQRASVLGAGVVLKDATIAPLTLQSTKAGGDQGSEEKTAQEPF